MKPRWRLVRGSAIAMAIGTVGIAGCGDKHAEARVLEVHEIRRTPVESDLALEEIVDIEWATDSTLFVAVDGGKALVIVGWDGGVRRRVARHGQGPGETQMTVSLVRLGDSVIASVDAAQFRITHWTTTGRFRSDARYQAALTTGAWETDEGLVLKSDALMGQMRFDLLDDSATSVRRASFVSRPSIADVSCVYCPAAVDREGRIAMAVSDTTYRILRTGPDGAPRTPIERPDLAAVRRTPREADSLRARWSDVVGRLSARGMRPEQLQRVRDVAQKSIYKKRFTARGLAYDSAGSLWAQRAVVDGDSAAIDVYDADAKLLGTIRLPEGTIMRRVRPRLLLVTITLESGEPVIIEYAVN
ncbi:MAG: SMP-30/gluconolactonase/LRE family protein [Gemmatimonadaceae bacterium]